MCAIRGLSASTVQPLNASTISSGEPNFPHNPAVVSVLYIGERPEVTPHNEELKKAKTTKTKFNQRSKK